MYGASITVLQALDKMLNFTTTLQGQSYRFHFTDEEMGMLSLCLEHLEL